MNPIRKTDIKEIHHPNELPRHLVVENGRIATLDGEIPILDLPDGTLVNVVMRADMEKLVERRIDYQRRRTAMLAQPNEVTRKKPIRKAAKKPAAKKANNLTKAKDQKTPSQKNKSRQNSHP